MTNKTIAITLAAIMVVGTLGFNPTVFAANGNANEVSPANGGISNGKPFQNIQGQIDQINNDLETLEDTTEDLQMQLDVLREDVDANSDDIAILEEILGTNCGFNGAIRTILSDGTVICTSINESEHVVVSRVFGSFVSTFNGSVGSSTAFCPSFLGSVTGGGFEQIFDASGIHDGAQILRNSATSSVSWTVVGQEHEFGGVLHNHDIFRAIAFCTRVL